MTVFIVMIEDEIEQDTNVISYTSIYTTYLKAKKEYDLLESGLEPYQSISLREYVLNDGDIYYGDTILYTRGVDLNK
jgi:hypothetical protein